AAWTASPPNSRSNSDQRSRSSRSVAAPGPASTASRSPPRGDASALASARTRGTDKGMADCDMEAPDRTCTQTHVSYQELRHVSRAAAATRRLRSDRDHQAAKVRISRQNYLNFRAVAACPAARRCYER